MVLVLGFKHQKVHKKMLFLSGISGSYLLLEKIPADIRGFTYTESTVHIACEPTFTNFNLLTTLESTDKQSPTKILIRFLTPRLISDILLLNLKPCVITELLNILMHKLLDLLR